MCGFEGEADLWDEEREGLRGEGEEMEEAVVGEGEEGMYLGLC